MLQALLYLLAFILIALAAVGVAAPRVSLALLGAAVFVLAFAWPTLAGAFG